MTKNLLVAFLSVFMLNTAIHSDDDIEEGRAHKKMRTEAPNSDTASFSGSSNGMTGLSRYSISSVSAPYQEKIERVMQERKIPYSQDTFAQNEINYKFLKKLLGYVPDEIAYGDTRCKNRRYPSVNMDCPSTPKKGFNVYRKSDRAWAWEYVQCGPTHSSTTLVTLAPVARNLETLFAKKTRYNLNPRKIPCPPTPKRGFTYAFHLNQWVTYPNGK